MSTEIPELRQEANHAYSVPDNCLTWALEYAYILGRTCDITPERAARMVIQSMAGRNMIHVIRSHWIGLSEHVDSVLPLRTTQNEYEG